MRAGVLAAGLVLALIPAAVASGHGNVVDHLAEDSVHDVAAESRMAEHTRSVTAADARAAAAWRSRCGADEARRASAECPSTPDGTGQLTPRRRRRNGEARPAEKSLE